MLTSQFRANLSLSAALRLFNRISPMQQDNQDGMVAQQQLNECLAPGGCSQRIIHGVNIPLPFASSPQTSRAHLDPGLSSVSPTPTGRTPGILPNPMSLPALRARCAAQGGLPLAFQRTNSATALRNSLLAAPKRSRRCCRSGASVPPGSPLPPSRRAADRGHEALRTPRRCPDLLPIELLWAAGKITQRGCTLKAAR